MALAHVNLFSDVLRLSTSISVILPQATTSQIGLRGERSDHLPPVLYLLHGLSDDETIWTRRTSIERYCAQYGLAVAMPRVDRSFYQDMPRGEAYWTYLSQELPRLVGEFFRVSQRREDTFVAGLSMGGYGAMRLALSFPERFAAAASLSGALDVSDPFVRESTVYPNAFGDLEVAGSDADLSALLGRQNPEHTPALYVACGTEDELMPMQQPFVDAATAQGISPVVNFGPGDHTWEYWDDRIQDVLGWLPLPAN